PGFVLNQPGMQGRPLLLAGDNFGSGSSREHAPWALLAYGFRAVLALSFADIFRGNALKNGLLPVALAPDTHRRLVELLERDAGGEPPVDLEQQAVQLPGERAGFEVDPFARSMLLAGTDELGYLLAREDAVAAFEAAHPPRVGTTARGAGPRRRPGGRGAHRPGRAVGPGTPTPTARVPPGFLRPGGGCPLRAAAQGQPGP